MKITYDGVDYLPVAMPELYDQSYRCSLCELGIKNSTACTETRKARHKALRRCGATGQPKIYWLADSEKARVEHFASRAEGGL